MRKLFNLFKNNKGKIMAEPVNPTTKVGTFIPTLIKNFLLWILGKFDVWIVLRELNDKWRDKAIQTKTPADDWACDAIDVIINYLSGDEEQPK